MQRQKRKFESGLVSSSIPHLHKYPPSDLLSPSASPFLHHHHPHSSRSLSLHAMYDGPLGLPFILEDRSGGALSGNTLLCDIYDRISIRLEETLRSPTRSVTMIRATANHVDVVPLIPHAVLDFTNTPGLGTVMFPPNQNMPMDNYMKRMNGG